MESKKEFTLKDAIDISIWKWQKYVDNGGHIHILRSEIPFADDDVKHGIIKSSGCGLCYYQKLKHQNTRMWSLNMCSDCPIALKGQTCTLPNSIYKNWNTHMLRYMFIRGKNNKEEMLKYAKEMLELLKTIKAEYDESSKNQ